MKRRFFYTVPNFDFISVWDTSKFGISNSYQIKLPLVTGGTYNFVVDWGDNSTSSITSYDQSEILHTYLSIGIYTVIISGIIEGWAFYEVINSDSRKIIEIRNFGCLKVKNGQNMLNGGQFANCNNLVCSSNDYLDIEGVTNMNNMFYRCYNFNSNLYLLNVSGVTDMSFLFSNCYKFNSDLSKWNVGSVTDMSGMFNICSLFNSDLSGWNVGNVTDMGGMFANCTLFNSDLSEWNVGNVTDMSAMFGGCTLFNSDLSEWNVGNVTDMGGMFGSCTLFNSDLSGWNVSNVIDFSDMFYKSSNFNQNLSNWNVSKATNMSGMFRNCTNFNQDLSNWNISGVTNMTNMFSGCGLSISNYSNILIGWSELAVNSGVTYSVSLGAQGIKYNSSAVSARGILTGSPYNWTINDGGLET